jgi:hypothetical protein
MRGDAVPVLYAHLFDNAPVVQGYNTINSMKGAPNTIFSYSIPLIFLIILIEHTKRGYTLNEFDSKSNYTYGRPRNAPATAYLE